MGIYKGSVDALVRYESNWFLYCFNRIQYFFIFKNWEEHIGKTISHYGMSASFLIVLINFFLFGQLSSFPFMVFIGA